LIFLFLSGKGNDFSHSFGDYIVTVHQFGISMAVSAEFPRDGHKKQRICGHLGLFSHFGHKNVYFMAIL